MMAALRDTAPKVARLGGHHNIAAAERVAAWSPTAITHALSTACPRKPLLRPTIHDIAADLISTSRARVSFRKSGCDQRRHHSSRWSR